MKYPAASIAYTVKIPLRLVELTMTVLQVNKYSKILIDAKREVLLIIETICDIMDGITALNACGRTINRNILKKLYPWE